MLLKARIDAPGALHHIILRGIERRRIFSGDQAQDNFINRLADIVTKAKTSCFAWALIPNHAHILLLTGQTPLAIIMNRLLTGYAVSYNWSAVKAMRRAKDHMKSDERILDDGEFAQLVLDRPKSGWRSATS